MGQIKQQLLNQSYISNNYTIFEDSSENSWVKKCDCGADAITNSRHIERHSSWCSSQSNRIQLANSELKLEIGKRYATANPNLEIEVLYLNFKRSTPDNSIYQCMAQLIIPPYGTPLLHYDTYYTESGHLYTDSKFNEWIRLLPGLIQGDTSVIKEIK